MSRLLDRTLSQAAVMVAAVRIGKGGEVIICVLHACVYALACGTYYCMTFWFKTFWHIQLPSEFFASGSTP